MFEFNAQELTMEARHQVVLRRNEVLAHELVTAERHIATLLGQADVLLERIHELSRERRYADEEKERAWRKVTKWRTKTTIFQEGMQTLEQEVAWLRHENDDLLRQLEAVRAALTELDIVIWRESADGGTPPLGYAGTFDIRAGVRDWDFRLDSIPHEDTVSADAVAEEVE